MERLLTEFVHALRSAGLRASPAETLDACAVAECVGWSDRELLKTGWSLALAKTPAEKALHDRCFDQFFAPPLAPPPGSPPESSDDGEPGHPSGLPGDGIGVSGVGSVGGGGTGGGASAAASAEPTPDGELARSLLADDRVALAAALDRAAQAVGLSRMSVFTQRGLYLRRLLDAMGASQLERDAERRADADSLRLLSRIQGLRNAARDYVQRQFELHGDASGEQLRERALRRARLDSLEREAYQDLQRLVHKMAQRLARRLARRRRRQRIGALDMRRTLAANAGHAGVLFKVHWKRRVRRQAKLIAVCDVSGSMRDYARFLLLFLYSLADALPKTRAFVFSDALSEVSDQFGRHPVAQAVELALCEQGGGGTDYAGALQALNERCARDIDHRTTVVVLGDSRNNHQPPRQDLLASLYRRCGQLWWLNPEPPRQWQSGDANMRHYAPYCHHIASCGTVGELERVVDDILRAVRP